MRYAVLVLSVLAATVFLGGCSASDCVRSMGLSQSSMSDMRPRNGLSETCVLTGKNMVSGKMMRNACIVGLDYRSSEEALSGGEIRLDLTGISPGTYTVKVDVYDAASGQNEGVALYTVRVQQVVDHSGAVGYVPLQIWLIRSFERIVGTDDHYYNGDARPIDLQSPYAPPSEKRRRGSYR